MPKSPAYKADLYSQAVIADPLPSYRAILALGPAVWLPCHRLWAVARYEDVRGALRNPRQLVSGRGIGVNTRINRIDSPITITSDGAVHRQRRRVLMSPLMPKPVSELKTQLSDSATRLVSGLMRSGWFDGIKHFASRLPVEVVSELVGLNAEGSAKMLGWAASTFDLLGPLNLRGWSALPRFLQLIRYVRRLDRTMVVPGGWAEAIFDAAERDEITPREAQAMIIDYIAPSLDTTILASGNMLWQLGTNAAAYDAIRADRSLIPGVVNECVRLASPIRGFTRYAAEPIGFGETVVAKGSRVLVLFGAANRDERRYPDPDRFDVHRNPRDHVGWGYGEHSCAGMHLARLEMETLLAALVDQVRTIEVGAPVPVYNNVLHGFKHLPARFG